MLGQAGPHHLLQRRRHPVLQAALGERRRRLVGVGLQERLLVAVEGPLAGEHLEHEDADAVEVAAGVALAAAHHLRRDVLRRPRRRRQVEIDQLVRRDVQQGVHFGQPEVHQLERLLRRAGVEDHQVARLEVAVDDALVVGGLEDVAQLGQQAAGPLRREFSRAPQQDVQVDAAQVFHDEQRAGGGVGSGVVVGDGVGVLEAGQDVDLAAEVLAGLGLGQQVFLEHLDHGVAGRRRLAG